MSVVKKKRISKKTRSAWRKTDITDVEEYLEDQRQEERIGSFAELKNEDLFVVDTTPLSAKRLTPKQQRKLNAKKPLRSLKALENTSKVQDPIVKRNQVKQKKAGRNIEEEVLNPTKPRHIQANKDRKRYYRELLKKGQKNEVEFTKDLWSDDNDSRTKIPGLKDEHEWINKDLALHNTRNVGKPVVKVHASLRHRTTKAKNFEVPHPGTSYNPSLEDHQKLLEKVVEREEKIIKEEKHLKRVTTAMFCKVTPEERDARRLMEMSAGMDEKGEEENNENVANPTEEENDEPYKKINPPVEIKTKSKQKRNKELKQKELQKKQAEKKALKKQIADLNRIKSIKAEVLVEEAELNDLKKRRKKVALQKKFEPKRLGRLKYVDPDIEANMPDDISGNIRDIHTESSLIIDRFKNFQKRNILPTSVYTGKQKQKKIKRFPRNSHKDPGVSFEMLREQRKKKQQSEPTIPI